MDDALAIALLALVTLLTAGAFVLSAFIPGGSGAETLDHRALDDRDGGERDGDRPELGVARGAGRL